MPFLPRTQGEILTFLMAHLWAKSSFTDTAQGSFAASLLGGVAEDIEGVEYRMKIIRDGFDFTKAVGEDLDERIADMPGMDPRRGEGYASGAVMTLTRGSSVGTLNVPIGSLFALGSDTRLQVRTTALVTFASGSLVFPAVGDTNYVAVAALTGGYAGNAVPGAVNVVVDAPSDVITCANTLALSGGRPRETDAELILRAVAYLSSLAKCQPKALEFFALNHIDDDGKGVSFAHAFEDPTTPAYTELVVDDGSGLTGLIQAGQTVTGTIPPTAGTTGVLYHNGPAVAPITVITNTTTGITHTLNPLSPDWVSQEERSVVHLIEGQAIFSAGDGWSIAGADYQVYTGFIRSFQAEIEGDTSDPLGSTGLRASGTRVKTMPPVNQSLDFVINIIIDTGADFDTVKNLVELSVVAYLASLGPGMPYFDSQLKARLHKIEGLTSDKSAVEIIAPGVDQLFPNSNRKSFSLGSILTT